MSIICIRSYLAEKRPNQAGPLLTSWHLQSRRCLFLPYQMPKHVTYAHARTRSASDTPQHTRAPWNPQTRNASFSSQSCSTTLWSDPASRQGLSARIASLDAQLVTWTLYKAMLYVTDAVLLHDIANRTRPVACKQTITAAKMFMLCNKPSGDCSEPRACGGSPWKHTRHAFGPHCALRTQTYVRIFP